MSTIGHLEPEAAKFAPETVFSSPMHLVDEVMLTRGEKLATLERWRYNILRELDATNEGMPCCSATAKNADLLNQIEEARKLLETASDPVS